MPHPGDKVKLATKKETIEGILLPSPDKNIIMLKLDNGYNIGFPEKDVITMMVLEKAVAKKEKIPLQLDISDFGITDALTISVSKGGIPCTVLGVAVRNIHSSIGIASLHDIRYLTDMLEHMLKNPAKKCAP